jgi:hypothetical protein
MRFKVAAAVLAFCILTGCSSGGSKPVAATSTPVTVTATPTLEPTPTTWTVAEASKRYLALAGPSNVFLAQWRGRSGGASVATSAGIARKIAQADLGFARGLMAGQWPAAAKRPIATMAALIVKDQTIWISIANSRSIAEVNASVAKFNDSVADAATAVRTALHLPSN